MQKAKCNDGTRDGRDCHLHFASCILNFGSIISAPMKKLILIFAALAVADIAAAQNADDYRGGWRTADSDPHTYQFSIRGDQVRGVYCTRCSDATTLAFVDGTLGAGGLTFVVTYVRPDGSTAYQDRAAAPIAASSLLAPGT